MNRHDAIFIKGLAGFSVLMSFLFIFFAMGTLTGGEAPQWEKVFAYVAVGYGLGNVYILSAAWTTGGSWTAWANKLIALCFFGVFLLDMWKSGVESRLEYAGALVVAGVLWLNWYAVKRIALRDSPQDDADSALASRTGRRPEPRKGRRPKKRK